MGNAREQRPILAQAVECACESLEDRLLLSRTIYVDIKSPGLDPDGMSWDSAYTDLVAAVKAAAAGDVVHVAAGTYRPTSGTSRSAAFSSKADVGIFGGYAGSGASDPDARGITQYETILSGDIGVAGDASDNSYHVVLGSGGRTAIIDGFTITGGNATKTGGGIYISNGSPTISNCVVTANTASDSGGGLYGGMNAAPMVIACTFIGNTASSGGGVAGYYANGQYTNCAFINNTATEYAGGGVNCNESDPWFTDCTFSGNTAAQYGGGLYGTNTSSPKLTRCTFSENSCVAEGGGAYFAGACSPSFEECTFTANSSGSGGGMELRSGVSTALTRCVFIANTARTGGALTSLGCSPTLNQCTFSANTARSGAAIYTTSSAAPSLFSCTVSGNHAGFAGGALYASAGTTASFVNSIVWGNTAPTAPGIYMSGATIVASYCDIQGGLPGEGNIDADPRFVRSPSPGTDRLWGTADDDAGDLQLRACSPAADAGSNLAVVPDTITDLAGHFRLQDIPTTADTGRGIGPIVDMGAFEARPALSASAGGPYVVIAGRSITLNGRGASDAPGELQYAWDMDSDGQFEDSVEMMPEFSSIGMPLGTIEVAFRVTDSSMNSVISTATLTIVPETVYVDAGATGANDGSSWNNAVTSLAVALEQAAAGQVLRVAGAVYRPVETTNRDISFELKTGVALFGGYAGAGAVDPDERDPEAHPTVLSGDIGVLHDNSDNSYAVVSGSQADSTGILDGFIVSGGRTSSQSAPGGGMWTFEGSPTVINCRFTGNLGGRGAAVAIYNASPTFANCVFSGNTAWIDGGAVYSNNSSPVFVSCTFSGNSAHDQGGGIYGDLSTATLSNCVLWGNAAPVDAQIYTTGAADITYSDVQGGFVGTGNLNDDPLFVRNPSAGDDGAWGTADDDYGDLHLRAGSPCIDAGNNAAVPADVTADPSGNPRMVDIPGVRDPGAIVDMGAYEAQAAVSLSGGDGEDLMYVRLSDDGTTLQRWDSAAGEGTPDATYRISGTLGIIIDLAAGDDTLTLDASNGLPGAPITLMAGEGNDTLRLTGTSSADSLDVQPDQIRLGTGTVTLSSLEQVVFDGLEGTALTIGPMTIARPVTLPAGKNLTLVTSSLNISGSGSLDLADNPAVIGYEGDSALTQVRQWILNGQIGATPALLSNAPGKVLAAVDNAMIHQSTWNGQPLTGFSQVLIKPALPGDTNLDDQVTEADYLGVLAGMGSSGTWITGDLNGDDLVTADDLALVTAGLGDGTPLAAGPAIAAMSTSIMEKNQTLAVLAAANGQSVPLKPATGIEPSEPVSTAASAAATTSVPAMISGIYFADRRAGTILLANDAGSPNDVLLQASDDQSFSGLWEDPASLLA